jgi:hypothetical protein
MQPSQKKIDTRSMHARYSLAFLCGIAALIIGNEVFACAACEGMASKDWQGQSVSSQPGWSVGYFYDFINQDQFRQGKSNLSYSSALAALGGSGNEVETQTATRISTLDADYNNADWGVSLQLPIYDRYHTTLQTGDGGFNYSNSVDMGDMRIIGKYTGISSDASAGLILGIKLATGATKTTFALGGTVDRALQAGTGSNDLIFGAFYVGQTGNLGWFMQGTAQHAVTTTDGYTPGDNFNVSFGARYAEFGQRVTPLIQLNLMHRKSDSGANASYFTGGPYTGMPLSGGDMAYIAPGVSVRIGGGFSAYGYLQLPVYQNVTGVQLVPSKIVSIGVKRYFH